MKHDLPDLPYPINSLEPFMSRETLHYHHDKHHKEYLLKLDKLILGTPFEDQTLDQIVKDSVGTIFNQAAQAWNHSFLWKCLIPDHLNIPSRLSHIVERDFGSVNQFKTNFIQNGMEVFGSGWLWLIQENGKLKLESTHDANNPLKEGKRALLTCDLWEHAYYIDYRNDRQKYLEAFVEFINWEFVLNNFTETWQQAA